MKKYKTGQDWYQYHKRKSGDEAVESSSSVRFAREAHRNAENNLSAFLIAHPQTFSAALKKVIFGKSNIDLEYEKLAALVESTKKNLNNEISKAYGSGANKYADDWVQRNPEKRKF
jgi:hypothetical protein